MKDNETMNSNGMRIVVLQNSDDEVMDVLSVKNFDEEFLEHLETAEWEWAQTPDGYDDYVYPYLRNKGYQFDVLSPTEIAIYKSDYV